MYVYVCDSPIQLSDPSGRQGQPQDAERKAAQQIRAAAGGDPVDFVLGLGLGPMSMVEVRDAMIRAHLISDAGRSSSPQLPPPPSQMPVYSVTPLSPAGAEAAHQQDVQRQADAYYERHPTPFHATTADAARVQHAIDPSGMGVFKGSAAIAYMAAGDDPATAQQKAANVESTAGVAMIAAHVVANGAAAAGAGDSASPPGERAGYLQQRAAAGGSELTGGRSFTAADANALIKQAVDASPAEISAVHTGLAEIRAGASHQEAGQIVHELLGAAGSQKGVDFIHPATIVELKTHFVPSIGVFELQMSMQGADMQTWEAQIFSQRAARLAGSEPLVKIRIQRHLFGNPVNGSVVRTSR